MLVTGLSGGGKVSVLRALEDLGYEAVDNPPLPMLEEMVERSDGGSPSVSMRARRGFDAGHRAGRAGAAASRTGGCGRNWSIPGPTRPRCCAATPRPGAAIRWRRRDG